MLDTDAKIVMENETLDGDREKQVVDYNPLLIDVATRADALCLWNDLLYILGEMEPIKREHYARLADAGRLSGTIRLFLSLGLIQSEDGAVWRLTDGLGRAVAEFMRTRDPEAIWKWGEFAASVVFLLDLLSQLDDEFVSLGFDKEKGYVVTGLGISVEASKSGEVIAIPEHMSRPLEYDAMAVLLTQAPATELSGTLTASGMNAVIDITNALCEKWKLTRPAYHFLAEAGMTGDAQPRGIFRIGYRVSFRAWPLETVEPDAFFKARRS